MPFFDRKCPACGALQIDCFEPPDAPTVLCLDCGEPTVRAWLTKAANVIGDECDFVQRNGTKHPIHFRSRSDHRLWLKQHHYRIADGADAKGSKSADIMDPVTLANAAALVSRTGRNSAWRDPELAPIGITSDDGLIRYLSDRNRAENRGEYGFSDR